MKQIKTYFSCIVFGIVLMLMPVKTNAMTFSEAKAVATEIQQNTLYDVTFQGTEANVGEQWYKFTTSGAYANYLLDVKVYDRTNSGYFFNVMIYDEYATECGGFGYGGSKIKFNPEPNKTYYIRMWQSFTDSRTAITFQLSAVNEAANSKEFATQYAMGTLVNDAIYSSADRDWYVFKTPAYSADYSLLINGISNYINFRMYDKNQTEIVGFYSQKYNGSISLQPNETYYIYVYPWLDNSTEYTFRIDAKEITSLDKTTISEASKGKNSFRVKWNSVKYAKGYEVRYSTKKNMQKAKIVKIGSAKKLSTKVKKLKKNTKYYIQVRAYGINSKGKKYYAKWSNKATVVTR